ncbi:MAG: hypothetical protein Q8J64_05075 [Thermodesulfovibrionales bacterium]|nr:hypothetical protein [Thermodesulfovibrionales bacterium]
MIFRGGTDVVLAVDHKWRDLPGLAAISVWLQEGFGLKTELVPNGLWHESLIRLRPKVFVVPILFGDYSRKLVSIAREMGTKIAVVMTEGRPNNLQGLDYMVGRHSGSGDADLWLTWSDTVRDYMIEKEVLPPEKIITVGAHRFDIYREPLSSLIMPRDRFLKKYGLDCNRPIVSWATNFTHAKFHFSNIEFLKENWRSLGLLKYPAYKDPAEVSRKDHEARVMSAEAIRKLLKARPEIQLAVKPHPSEEHDYYEGFVRECRAEFGPRVVFIGSEYIWDLLAAADVHIDRLCTTGVEAWFLDTPSIDLHLMDYMPWSVHLEGSASEALRGNDLVDDADSLIEKVDYYLKGGRPTEEMMRARQEYILRWLYRVDGNRCLEAARALAGLLDGAGVSLPGFKWEHVDALFSGVKTRLWLRLTHRVDTIRQVDKVISSGDAKKWLRAVRGALLPAISELKAKGSLK